MACHSLRVQNCNSKAIPEKLISLTILNLPQFTSLSLRQYWHRKMPLLCLLLSKDTATGDRQQVASPSLLPLERKAGSTDERGELPLVISVQGIYLAPALSFHKYTPISQLLTLDCVSSTRQRKMQHASTVLLSEGGNQKMNWLGPRALFHWEHTTNNHPPKWQTADAIIGLCQTKMLWWFPLLPTILNNPPTQISNSVSPQKGPLQSDQSFLGAGHAWLHIQPSWMRLCHLSERRGF